MNLVNMMQSIVQGMSTFKFSHNLVFSIATAVFVFALVSVVTYRQLLSHEPEQLETPKPEPTHKPKTWRLFIDHTGDNLRPLTDVALRTALATKLGVDLDRPRLRLVALKSGCYCATLSLKPMKDPFISRRPFVLEIDADIDGKTSVTVTPDDDFLRWTTLYDGTDGKTDAVDLVVVPGLSSHPYGSFRSPMNAAENWLRDYLHKDLDNVRVLVYGYNTNLRNREGKESISDLSISLLEAIHSYRTSDQTTGRPIIFIGHSLGGLLIKQALVLAHTDSSPQDELFLKTCYGVLFLGVPNRGLRNENLSTILGYSPTTQLVTDLVVDSDSEVKPYLRTLGESFIKLFQGKGLDIVAFYETYKTPTVVDQGGLLVGAGESRLLVTQDSATMIDGNGRHGNHFPIAANHSMMVKYDTRHDPIYQAVVSKLREMTGKAPNAVRETISSMHDLSPSQIQELNQLRLDASIEHINSDIAERPNGIAPRCNGTLEWFLAEPIFKEWRDTTVAFPLWICGPPGQGKSVLAMFLTGHLGEYFSSHKNKTTAVLSFFCNAQRSESSQPTKILYGLLLQMISCKEDYELIGQTDMKSISDSSFDKLWARFQEILLKSNKQRVYCVIDAFDECSSTLRPGDKYCGKTERGILIDELVRLSSQKESRLRLLVTSRPGEDDITSCLRGQLRRYDLEANNDDLGRFVSSSLTNLNHINNQLKGEIVQKLNSRAGGTFLWVSMVLRELSELQVITPHRVNETLGSVPKELDKMYKELIQRLTRRDACYGKILAWVAYAKRPLSVMELSNALKFDPHNEPNPYTRLSDMEGHDPNLDSNWINERLGNFLSVYRYPKDFRPDYIFLGALKLTEYIVFRHQSINDFFNRIKNSADFQKFLINGSDPDLYLAQTCVSYLNAEEWKKQTGPLTWATRNVPRFPFPVRRHTWEMWKQETNSSPQFFFLHYAATNWYKHLITTEQAEHKDIKASITQLLHKNGCFIKALNSHLSPENPESFSMSPVTGSRIDHIRLGDIAIKLGIPWLIEQILDGKVVNQSIPVLRLACDNLPLFRSLLPMRKEQVLQMLPPNFLLEAVRSHDAYSGIYSILEILPNKESVVTGEVLEAAAARNDYRIMKQLLESRANVTITDDCLRKAAQNTNPNVIRLLLERRHVSAALANELVRISIACPTDYGPLQVLFENYSDQICGTEEYPISTMFSFIRFALEGLVKQMSRHITLTEDKILLVLKYYQWFDVFKEHSHDDRILQKLLSPSPVQIQITDNIAELAALYVPRASEMDHILQLRLRASGSSISENMVAAAAGNKHCGKDILELFCRHESQDQVRGKFTETAMFALPNNAREVEEIISWIVDSPLLPNFDAITLPVVSSAIYNPIPGANILKILIQQGFTLKKKEDIIKVAGTSWLHFYQEFVQHSLSSTSWRLHLTSREILNFLLRGSGIGLQQYDSLLNSVLEDYTDVFLNFSSDTPRYGTIKWTDLHYAVLFDDSDFIREEGSRGANVNCRDWMQSTPLHLASSLGQFGFVEVLLDNKADINARDKYNRTPLHYAAYAGHLLVVSTLLKRGASVDHIDFIYQTPLHYAVQYGHFSSARKLLDYSADANTLDAYGRSANEYIQEKEKRDYPLLLDLEEPQEPRVPGKATEYGGRARLHNVIFILTSQLLGTYDRDTCPGFLQLGHCLALLDEENKALFAYTQGFEQEVRSIPDHTRGPRRNRELCSPFWYMSLSYHELACSDPSRSETQKREGCKHDGVFRVCKTCVNGVFCRGCWKVRKRLGFGRNNACRGHDFITVPEVKFVGKGPECNEGVGRGTTDSVIEWLKKIRDEIGVDPATEQMEEYYPIAYKT